MHWTLDKSEKLSGSVAILLLGLVFLRACQANAEPIPSDPDPIPLAKGAVAPFDGDLWPVVRSLRLVLRAESCQERAQLDLVRAARQFQAELTYTQNIHLAERDADAQRIGTLHRVIEDLAPWYLSPPFVAVVAVTVTLAAVVAVGYLIAPFTN